MNQTYAVYKTHIKAEPNRKVKNNVMNKHVLCKYYSKGSWCSHANIRQNQGKDHK